MNNRLNEEKYLIRRKVLTVGGGQFHIYNDAGELVLFCKQKAFKLKEDIRLYTDENMDEEIITIHARTAIDFSAMYDVIDTKENKKIGALQRKGARSMIRDEWTVFDENDYEIGIIIEDSTGLALLRRFLSNLIPQNFDLLMNGKKVVDLKQQFNPFVYKLEVDYSVDDEKSIDRRMGIASGILIAAIEGRQN